MYTDAWSNEHFSDLPKVPGTSIYEASELGEHIDEIVARPALILNTHEYSKTLEENNVSGRPDLFVKIGKSIKSIGKFGQEVKIGVSPVVVNKSFFTGADGNYEDLIRFAKQRADDEIVALWADTRDNISMSEEDRDEQSVSSWIAALTAAENDGKYQRLVTFYKARLKRPLIKGKLPAALSPEDKYKDVELELLNRSLRKHEERRPKGQLQILKRLRRKT